MSGKVFNQLILEEGVPLKMDDVLISYLRLKKSSFHRRRLSCYFTFEVTSVLKQNLIHPPPLVVFSKALVSIWVLLLSNETRNNNNLKKLNELRNQYYTKKVSIVNVVYSNITCFFFLQVLVIQYH